MAEGLLNRFGQGNVLVPEEVLAASDNLKKTIKKAVSAIKGVSESTEDFAYQAV